jgi:predicted secreted protein
MIHVRVFALGVPGIAAVLLVAGCVPDGCQIFGADEFCDDDRYCNGPETCNWETGLCDRGEAPCVAEGLLCDEDNDRCAECLGDEDCIEDGTACYDGECVRSLTGQDSGGSVSVAVSERFIVTLGSNMSTGSVWGPAEIDTSVLEVTGLVYVAPDPPAIGGGELVIWEFTGVAPGTTTVLLRYCGPDGSMRDSFEVTVDVVSSN